VKTSQGEQSFYKGDLQEVQIGVHFCTLEEAVDKFGGTFQGKEKLDPEDKGNGGSQEYDGQGDPEKGNGEGPEYSDGVPEKGNGVQQEDEGLDPEKGIGESQEGRVRNPDPEKGRGGHLEHEGLKPEDKGKGESPDVDKGVVDDSKVQEQHQGSLGLAIDVEDSKVQLRAHFMQDLEKGPKVPKWKRQKQRAKAKKAKIKLPGTPIFPFGRIEDRAASWADECDDDDGEHGLGPEQADQEPSRDGGGDSDREQWPSSDGGGNSSSDHVAVERISDRALRELDGSLVGARATKTIRVAVVCFRTWQIAFFQARAVR